MTTTAIIVNVLLAATVLVLIVGLCVWAIVSSRPPRVVRRRRPEGAVRARAARRPRDVPAR